MNDKQATGPPPSSPILQPTSAKKGTANSSVASSTASAPLRPPRTTTSAPVNSNANQAAPAINGTHTTSTASTQTTKGRRKNEPPPPPDPTVMYENVKNRIAALEEATVQGEEEERKIAEEARRSVKGMSDSVIQQKYIELFQEMKRLEREHAREKQKLTKDKDSSKSQLTKVNQAKNKLENLARELQKDNKKLREESKRLAISFEDAQEEIIAMKSEMERRLEKSSIKKPVPRDPNSPDIVVKVVCRYRAELFFKISRKTKLSRLFNAWTSRMEISSTLITPGGPGSASVESLNSNPNKPGAPSSEATVLKAVPPTPMSFIFTHMGRTIDPEQTAEEVGIESNDEILAVEMMDLTSPDDDIPETQKQKLRKNWTENPAEAKQTLDDIFNGVVRERLKDVLRQYELREKHFETVIRSKELEVLLSRARAEEQKQLAEGERQIATVAEAQNQQLRHQMEDMQNSQARLMDKLISCCREPTGERTQRLFAFLREELEKRGTKTPPDIPPTPSSTTTAPVLGLDVPKAVRPSNGSNGLVAPLIPSNVPALVNGSSSVAG